MFHSIYCHSQQLTDLPLSVPTPWLYLVNYGNFQSGTTSEILVLVKYLSLDKVYYIQGYIDELSPLTFWEERKANQFLCNHPQLICNSKLASTTSMSIYVALLSGLPIKNRIKMWHIYESCPSIDLLNSYSSEGGEGLEERSPTVSVSRNVL